MPELNLNANDQHPVIRVGDTVHRPMGWWSPAVHDLLAYLASIGFSYSPRVLGVDEQGREILTYIEGESGKDGWAKIVTDDGLRRYARLLREYHNAVAGYHPPANSLWAYNKGATEDGDIMCHGDFGVWNIVWNGDIPIGIVDWDFAVPARPKYDILYALEYATPFRDDVACLNWHHFPSVPDRKHRIKVFADEYGYTDLATIVDDIADMQQTVGRYEAYLSKKGLQPQADWVQNGDLDEIEKRIAWEKSHRSLFE